MTRAYDVAGRLAPLVAAADGLADGRADDAVNLDVTGPGGGQWRLLLPRRDAHRRRRVADRPRRRAACHLNANTFASLACGRTTAGASIARGQVVIEGTLAVREQVLRALEQVTAPIPQNGCPASQVS